MKKIMSAIGWTCFLIGIGYMDSMSVVVPVVMIFAGLTMFVLSMKGEINDNL